MKVLIVDDDLSLADIISFTVRRAGMDAIQAYDGQMALECWQKEEPDLILLDLNLPRMSGFKVCQKIRAASDVPIIILSVRDKEEDIIRGLKYGADDYILKPFSPRQMIARIEAVLRRARQPKALPDKLQAGGLTLCAARKELFLGDELLFHLTRLECRLLEVLMRNFGQVIPAGLLIDAIWGPYGGDRLMLKQLVYRLRQKFHSIESPPVILDTITGVGYQLRIAEENPEGLVVLYG
jgi:DNA-binding response OmpR family regulator